MALFWVQYWGYLPAVVEEQMNDGSGPGGRQSLGDRRDFPIRTTTVNLSNRRPSLSEIPLGLPSTIGAQRVTSGLQGDEPSTTSRPVPTGYPLPAVPSSVVSQAPLPEQSLSYSVSGSGAQGTSQYGLAQPYTRETVNPFNMATVSTSLPDYHSNPSLSSFSQHRLPSSLSTPAMMYQFPQVPQFAGQTALNYHNNANWMTMPLSSQYPTPYPQNPQLSSSNPASHSYPQHLPGHTTQLANFTPGQQIYPNPSWTLQQHHQQQNIAPYYFPGPGQVQVSQGRLAGRYNVTPRRASQPHMEAFSRTRGIPAGGGSLEQGPEGIGAAYGFAQEISTAQSEGVQAGSGRMRRPSSSSRPSIPRGPPRKPKQSGHALWVGNLPPATTVIELKDYFSRDATHDIESVFLISKSNCAFVNYKTEEACMAAMTRFHDSRFKGVRLVCRLRRTLNNPAPAVPTGPSSAYNTTSGEAPAEVIPSPTTTRRESISREDAAGPSGTQESSDSPKKDRFFILKSLTVEDLEASVRNGIWATQAHNEITLNEAYASANNVYLIFSANKSGEYFGYARMTSPISDNTTSEITWAPRAQPTEDANHPKAIPTPATEFAPKGRVIDDSARGTIFWEADTDEENEEEKEKEKAEGSRTELAESSAQRESMVGHPAGVEEEGGFSQGASGRPFKIEWLCTTRLPFYRTRGLRNPWNGNREVKIARDGTELETSVGRRLFQMFHRVAGVAAPMSAIAVGIPPAHHQPFPQSAPVVSSSSLDPPSTTAAVGPFYGQYPPMMR